MQTIVNCVGVMGSGLALAYRRKYLGPLKYTNHVEDLTKECFLLCPRDPGNSCFL